MMNRNERPLRRPDYVLLGVVAILLIFGLLAVYSSSFAFAIFEYDDPNYFIFRQTFSAILGTGLMLLLLRVDYHRFKRWSPYLMLASVLVLIAVIVPEIGYEANNARRWIKLGPLPAIQPSEIVKLVMVVYMAAWLSTRGARLQEWSRGVVPFVVLLGTVGLLIVLQPDFGTAVLIAMVGLTMFFVSGANIRHLITLVAAGSVAAIPVIFTQAYRADRIVSFLDPWADPLGRGYQIIQSLIALGSGGIFGLGLGVSRQKFLYVPGSHTDAIFAIIGEELGLIGAVSLLLLMAGIALRGFKIGMEAPDDFGALLAFGITCWLVFQAAMNIGGITRTIPFTGITLPLISFGGSSLVATMAAIGVLLNVSRHRLSATERKHGVDENHVSKPMVLQSR